VSIPRFPSLPRLALMLALCPPVPFAALAQQVPTSTHGAGTSAMPCMDHGDMPDMDMPAATATVPAVPATELAPVRPDPTREADHATVHGMDAGSAQERRHVPLPGMDHGALRHPSQDDATGMAGHIQTGDPPTGSRDPDYSAGIAGSPAHHPGMAMGDDPRLGKLLFDQLEAFHGREGHGQRWHVEGWLGGDYDKLGLRTEGERTGATLQEGSLEAFWGHALAPYWDTQLGVRIDAGEGPSRRWAAFGIQGLAPYWFELEATGYAGPSGRTAARLRVDYELLFTQRLILQPELEIDAYGKADPARGLGSGVSDASLGLRLRYEFHRQFAPYLGVVWTRRFGGTAGHARDEGRAPLERQWIAGLRIWL
jgi:copper resistance protein B